MVTAHALSNILAYILAFFSALCVQAHLTPLFTPTFSANLAALRPHHNKVIFGWANISDTTTKYVLVAVNAVLVVLLALPGYRATGLKWTLGLLLVGFYSDMRLDSKKMEHALSHVVLCGITGAAIWVR